MRIRPLAPQRDEQVNVTPLIDVVMCLIIFFMICGKLAQDEQVKGITLPRAALGQELADQQNRLVLNLVPTGAGERPMIEVHGLTIPYDALRDVLRRESSHNRDLRVILRADQSTRYEYVAPVLVACAEAGIHSVDFSTVK